MCTLILLRNAFPGFPLIAVANRDEQFSRPSAGPSLKDGPIKILSPADLLRGGTWIGVNDRGLLVAITNRKDVQSVAGRRSRGELVADALKRGTVEEALYSVVNRKAEDFNGFHLVIADASHGHLIVGSGESPVDEESGDLMPGIVHEPLREGLTVVTNFGNGVSTPRGSAIAEEWERLKGLGLKVPRTMWLSPLLRRHAPTHRETTCLHPQAYDPDYGTVSSSFIRLTEARTDAPAAWQYWHADRSKAAEDACALSLAMVPELPIVAR